MERRLARLLWHRRGWRVRLLAFTSYGVGGGPPGTGWVRVIGRALLTDAPGPEAELVRGWRRFMTLPLDGVAVEIAVGGHRGTVRTGNGGYVDTTVRVDLSPGWHDMLMSSHHGEPSRTTVRVVGAGRAGRCRERHRRHRAGDCAAPAVARVLEHLRPARVDPSPGDRHAGPLPAPARRRPRAVHGVRVDRPVEPRAVAGAVPGPARLPARPAADDRLGADRRPVVPVRPAAQARQPAPAAQHPARSSPGRWSATTGSTTRPCTTTWRRSTRTGCGWC